MEAEEKMLSVKGVTNTEGSAASSSKTKITFLSSKTFLKPIIKLSILYLLLQ